MVTRLASSLAQDGESSPAETSVLTTMLRRQLEVKLEAKRSKSFFLQIHPFIIVIESRSTTKCIAT